MKNGFTVIEMFIVIGIVGVIASVIVHDLKKSEPDVNNISVVKVHEIDGYNVYQLNDKLRNDIHYITIPKPIEK